MEQIFISYRRSDAEAQAGRLYSDLKVHFPGTVWIDVSNLEKGEDFRKIVERRVATSKVILAVIGKSWLTTTDEHGTRRLDDPDDLVRKEISLALSRGIPVIPVLVSGATVPRADDLPEAIKDLSYRNSVELTHARWDSDLQQLLRVLEPIAKPGPWSIADLLGKRAGIASLTVGVIVAIGVGIWLYKFGFDHQVTPVHPDRQTAAVQSNFPLTQRFTYQGPFKIRRVDAAGPRKDDPSKYCETATFTYFVTDVVPINAPTGTKIRPKRAKFTGDVGGETLEPFKFDIELLVTGDDPSLSKQTREVPDEGLTDIVNLAKPLRIVHWAQRTDGNGRTINASERMELTYSRSEDLKAVPGITPTIEEFVVGKGKRALQAFGWTGAGDCGAKGDRMILFDNIQLVIEFELAT